MGEALRQLQGVIFDLDGTLVNTLGDFQEALHRTMADLALPPVSNALIKQSIGKGSEHLIRSLLAHQFERQEADQRARAEASSWVNKHFDRAWQRYQHHYLKINGQFSPVYPGAAEALESLVQQSVPMACLTNKPMAFAKALLAQKKLNHHFLHVFGGDSFERKKPDPLPMVRTCEALGTKVSHTLMVGDSSNDAQAAHAAGCPVILVTYGYNHGQAIQNTLADAWIDSLADLPPLLHFSS